MTSIGRLEALYSSPVITHRVQYGQQIQFNSIQLAAMTEPQNDNK